MPGITPDKKSSRSGQRPKPFQPAIGTDYGAVEEVEAKNRGFLLRIIALTTAGAIVVTGGYGLIAGNYMAVIAVWAVAGPFIGAMVTYYFGPRRNDTG
jgi:hypothetical protein